MAKDLPYFKFFCSEWSDGDITLEDYEIQGIFINVCAYYWSNECRMTKDKLLKKFKSVSEQINILFDSKIIKENSNEVIISFLNEQWSERSKVSEQNSKTAKQMWERKRKESERNANASEAQCESDANKRREEEKREEKKRKENTPDWLEFLAYGKEKEPSVNESALKNKYDAWVANGWKDGNNNQVKNWKSKLLQTMPYIKKDAAAVTKFEIPKYIP